MITGNSDFQNRFKRQKPSLFDLPMKDMEILEGYDEIHWWQFPLKSFSIKLESGYKQKFFERVYKEREKSMKFSESINEESKKYGKNWSFKKQRQLLFQYKKRSEFVPAWVVFALAKYLEINLNEIENNIESYVSFRGRLVVREPKLPVKVTPEFSAIAVHIMCDGCNHEDAISYFQKDLCEKRRFLKLAANVFGDYRTKYNERCEILPKIFAKVISEHYHITDYSCFNARIPDMIKKGSFKHRLSALISFILDEGNVSFGITLHSSNKLFLLDIKEIAESLGYICNTLQAKRVQKTPNPAFRFRISPRSIKKLYLDLETLYKKFPTLNFSRKMRRISNMYKIQTRGWNQRNKGETRGIIIKELKKSRKTTFELSESAEVCLKTVYHHLKRIKNLTKTQEGTQIYYSISN
jgi:hypothetical protein